MGAKAAKLLARGFVPVPNHLRELEVRPFGASRHSVNYALHREFPYGAGKRLLPKAVIREAERHIKLSPNLKAWALQLVGIGDRMLQFKAGYLKGSGVPYRTDLRPGPKADERLKRIARNARRTAGSKSEIKKWTRTIHYTAYLVGFRTEAHQAKVLKAVYKNAPKGGDLRGVLGIQNQTRHFAHRPPTVAKWFKGEGEQQLPRGFVDWIQDDPEAVELVFPSRLKKVLRAAAPGGPMGHGGNPLTALGLMAIKGAYAAATGKKMTRENSVWTEFTGRVELKFCLSK